MEQTLGYIIFAAGWPALIIGSVWMWKRVGLLTEPAATFLKVTLISFYVLGYVCTVYWMGLSWPVGVFPAFFVFVALFVATIRAVRSAGRVAR